MANNKPDNPTRILTIQEDDQESFIPRSRCCFNFPCFGSSATATATAASSISAADERWWGGPIRAFRRLREWSEIVAGPKWKTFIRRLSRHRNHHRHVAAGKFQYDPLSYALNFDEGPGQNGNFEFVDGDEYAQFPDFASRFVVGPVKPASVAPAG